MDADHIPISTALALLGAAFGAWAFVLGWVLWIVRKEVHELKTLVEVSAERQVKREDAAHADRVELEGRMSTLEAEFRARRWSSHVDNDR